MAEPASRLRRVAAYVLLQLAVFGILLLPVGLFIGIPLVVAAILLGAVSFSTFHSVRDFLVAMLLLASIVGSMIFATDFLLHRHYRRSAQAVLIAYPFAICVLGIRQELRTAAATRAI
jgi:hypothetical protein